MATNQPPPSPIDQIIARSDWRAQLLADYEQTADRLQSAYARVIPRLQTTINGFNGALNDFAAAHDGQMPSSNQIRGMSQYADLLARIEAEMREFSNTVRNEATVLQDRAVQTGVNGAQEMAQDTVPGIDLSNVWLRPDPLALQQLVGYVDSEAFRLGMAQFGANAAENIGDVIIASVAQGKSPLATARIITNWFNVPYSWAENSVRTVQMWSYRSASHETYRQNADVVTGWMWWAALDARTCLCCLSEHGREFTLNEKLIGHHRCRCVEVPIVNGSRWTSGVQTGRQWFEEQSPEFQRQSMGGAMYNAWRQGAVGWDDMAHPYHDPVYGTMLREAGVRDVLGVGASTYYVR